MTQGGPWTSHGHAIPGVTVDGPRPERVARCGGPGLCAQCSQEAAIAAQRAGVIEPYVGKHREGA